MFLFALIITTISMSPLIIWLTSIRPYCVRHGLAYTPGALWWITLWIDWQHARELAKTKKNSGIRFMCALFFVVHSIWSLLAIISITV